MTPRSPRLALLMAIVAAACDGASPGGDGSGPTTPATPPAEVKPPVPVVEPLSGGPAPSLLLAQAWFWKDAAGKAKPGPARLEIWREVSGSWKPTRVEDADSNVFHKAIPYQGGLVTVGGEKAVLKRWTFEAGQWKQDKLWEKAWGGRFNRLRDIEIADVDGDGKDEFVIATHDAGVVAVVSPEEAPAAVVEMDQKADTFVHEIEIGDVDGDGKLEFFATPSGRNEMNKSQSGGVVMYRWDGKAFQRTDVEPWGPTHAKEILVRDLDGDGRAEVLAVMEAETDASRNIVKPVEIRRYRYDKKGGKFVSTIVGTVPDRQTRFLVPGDFDGDGTTELVAASMTTGLWLFRPDPKSKDGPWAATNFDKVSSGFEHTTLATDLDGDGSPEVYVAADDQHELRRYTWNKATGAFDRVVLGRLADDTITWNIEATRL